MNAERNQSINLTLAGDVMLGRWVNEFIRAYGPAYPWGNMLPFLQHADLSLINLECVIARDGHPWTRTPKVFHFRADPSAIEVLRLAGIDCVSLANNHTLDFEEPALLETLELLEANGIAYAGAGRNSAEAQRPAFLQASGIKVAVVAFTDNEPAWAATATTPGVNYLYVSTRGPYIDQLAKAIESARLGGADLVVVSAHWGPNMRERPTKRFCHFAHAVIDAGADIFQGHSAHIFQGIEIYRGKPIFYDTGDFVDDYAVDEVLRNDQALLFNLSVSKAGTEGIDLIPALISDCQVNRAVGNDFDQIARRIKMLSQEMGTEIERVGDHLEVSLHRRRQALSA